MKLGGSIWRLVTGTGRWFYCRLRVSGHWIGKVSGNSTTRFRRWLLKGKEKKSLTRLGRQLYSLYQEGQMGWPEDGAVRETLQALENIDQKRGGFGDSLQGRENRYRQQVKRLKEMPSATNKESEAAAVPESEPE